jgi:SecD/SecF fusion protein
MKRFTWKIVFCVLPVLLSMAVVAYAYNVYLQGGNGFKLGVDLAGGTDLIYEVDMDKFPDGKLPDNYKPEELAASLKRRIDPADLYNVTIRPVGQTRVEIILPTGGTHQAEAEERVWNELLDEIAKEWKPESYKVGTGKTTELVARVNEQYPDAPITDPVKHEGVKDFIEQHYQASAYGSDKEKQEAGWKKLLAEVAKKWPPRRYEVGRGRLQVLVNRILEQHPEVTPKMIGAFIDDHYRVSRERRHLSGEQVQEVKELISRVGSLKFLILANTTDDAPAIEAAKKYFAEVQKDEARKATLDRLAVAGKPPPSPVNTDGSLLFPVANDPGVPHSYTWVELGRKERQILGLSNAAGKGTKGSDTWWGKVAAARDKGEAIQIPEQGGFPRGGMLLYSRNVLNPRLPEKEAGKLVEYFVLTRDPEKGKEITGQYLTEAKEDSYGLELKVQFRFNSRGAELFQELTTKNKPEGSSENAFRRYLAVALDEKIESAPRLNAIISDSGVIEGGFTKAEVDRLVRILRAGALPASLKAQPVSESTMGATLGADTIRAGTISVIIAFVAILVFMLVYYRFAGIVACLALLANLLLTVAFMVIVNATFTLPGLAGLVLMLGMAVDANVLIYERLREERDRGASLALAIRNGYDRAFPTIIDTHLSSIFTAIVLYAVGNDQLKGFGISLTVGLIISLFTSLYMTRLMFDIWLFKGWLHKLSMFRLFSRPNIDFMGIRYYWFTATILLTIFGASVFILRLENGLNIDFMGGTAYSGKLKDYTDIKNLRDELEQQSNLPDLSVDSIFVSNPDFSQGGLTKLFTVRTSEKDADKVQAEISRVLGNRLEKVSLLPPKIDADNQHAILSFVEPGSDKPAYASRAQVSLLLTNEFKNQGLESVAQDFVLEGLGQESDGRFKWMELQLVQPVDRDPKKAHDKLAGVFKATEDKLASQPQPERLDKFDSQLAAETQLRALYAILASWGAILLYLWFRFGNWTFGLAAVLCLIHDLFFTLGIIAFCHYTEAWAPALCAILLGLGAFLLYLWFRSGNWKVSLPAVFCLALGIMALYRYLNAGAAGLASALLIQDFKIDLPAVAALLTLVGYSVNDTIVVFDRIREVRGKNPLLTPQTINDSVNQTLSRTLLTSFATWLVVIVLYIFGGEGVHLFAFVMVVGVIVGTYSSIYIASPLLLIFGEGAKKASVREKQELKPAGALS